MDARSQNDDLIVQAAEAVVAGNSLENVARPFLDLLHRVTGLDSTYLTQIRWDENEQEILYADNRGEMIIPEDLVVVWEDTLCRRALASGERFTNDVPRKFPNSEAAKALGIQTYVSVPVIDPGQHILGTLCAASSRRKDISPETLSVMELFARLIADQWKRDQLHIETAQRAAQAEGRLRERAMFLAEAEHKLKSPLTILRGWSELLSAEWNSFSEEDRMNAVKTMHTAALQAAGQVDELLDEARSQVLTTQLSLETIDLVPLLRRVGEELNGSTSRHQIRCDVPATIPVIADETATWQVLWHLGENAIKYSPDGGEIEISAEMSPSGYATVCIRDHGLGVPEDADIFAPFIRGSIAAKIPGTGLGLHIVRNLVQSMNGKISCRKAASDGSEFFFSLPVPTAAG